MPPGPKGWRGQAEEIPNKPKEGNQTFLVYHGMVFLGTSGGGGKKRWVSCWAPFESTNKG